MTTLMPNETAVCISNATSGTKWNDGFHAGRFPLIFHCSTKQIVPPQTRAIGWANAATQKQKHKHTSYLEFSWKCLQTAYLVISAY